MSDETMSPETAPETEATPAGDGAPEPVFKEDRTLVERYVNNVTGRLGAGAWLTKTLRKVKQFV